MKSSQRATKGATERRPLLETVPVSAPHPRYSSPRSRAISHAATLFLSGCLIYLGLSVFLFPSLPLPPFGTAAVASLQNARAHEGRMPLDMLEELMLLTPQEEMARKHSKYYTSGPHLGGKNYSQALWTQARWLEYGIPEVEIETYEIYANYPKGHRLALLKEKREEDDEGLLRSETIEGTDYELVYEAGLEEEVLEADPTTGLKDRIPTFHGYSANGNVTAEYIFANYGTYQDFEDLLSHGVNLTGKVILCKYGYVFRGLKVKRAQDLGAVGVLIYSDPGDDRNVTELNGYKAYPDGPARNKNSVQRGSVQFLSFGPGDPTTPGYASKPGARRQDPSAFIPSIPSLPISYVDALPLLLALNDHGLNSSDLGKYWRMGGLYHKNVTYNIGPAPGVVVNLVNEVDYEITPMWNVIGRIPGYIKDETVILGNHRDAWIAGGAGDPNSGSAALLEIVRSFGKMLHAGWKPTRTIIIASWDGEEYGLLGSTEWVEDHQQALHTHALAYLNVDVGTRGPVFKAAANPLLHALLRGATSRVADPNAVADGKFNVSVGDRWNGRVAPLGSGSDYTAFQDHIGVPSVDMGFGEAKDGAVYHYHSNYDSFAWMEKFGDPGFGYHVAIAKIWGLMALRLAESPIVRFNATDYAVALEGYLEHIIANANSTPVPAAAAAVGHHPHCRHHSRARTLHTLHELSHVLARFSRTAARFDGHACRLAAELARAPSELPWWRRYALYLRARAANQRYKFLDRAFLHTAGLADRPWFRHVVFAPGKWTGYAGDTFPGLAEAVRDEDWAEADRWAWIIRGAVELAGRQLL